jgi:hypothetical protein
MANPNPQHNPTDGLGVAAVVLLTATPVVLTKVGSQVAVNAGTTPGGHQYAVTLSLANSATTTLTEVLTDVKGNTYTRVGAAVYKSYNDPAFTGYNPSNAISGNGLLANQVAYSALVASVGASSGVITALHVGQAIVEAQFPTFDSTTGIATGFIYSQVIVTVTP